MKWLAQLLCRRSTDTTHTHTHTHILLPAEAAICQLTTASLHGVGLQLLDAPLIAQRLLLQLQPQPLAVQLLGNGGGLAAGSKPGMQG